MPSMITFAEYCINPEVGTVAGPDGDVHIEPKNMDVLLVLLQAKGEVVSREEILRQVWTNQEVSDDVINTAISKIRKALSEVGNSSQYLQTVPRKGYRLVYPQLTNVTAIHANKQRNLESGLKNQEGIHIHSISSLNLKQQLITEEDELLTPQPLSIIKVDEKNTDNRSGITSPNPARKHLLWSGFAIFVVVAGLLVAYAKWQQQNLENQLLALHKQQELSYSSFVIQAKRRNELVAMITQRLSIERTQQFEKFFAKYHPLMNKEEQFVFAQIRGITTGTLFSANTTMLQLIDNNPQFMGEFPLMDALHKHLAFWVSKYHNVFIPRDDMCLLYVGVEDGVPYPSELDKQITKWLGDRGLL